MNSENSVNAESVSAEVEQPVGPGMGCIAALSFCIGGAFVGANVGEWIRLIILSSYAELVGKNV